MNDYKSAFDAAAADISAIIALLGFTKYPGVDPVLRAIADLILEKAENQVLREERDAALAKVAELEKQEPVATVAKVPGEDWNGLHFYRDLQGMQPGTKLYAAPVAQAQHSVPDGYRLIRLEHFAAIKAQLNPEQVDAYRGRNIYDEDKVYANWNAYRSALDEIKDVFQQIDWDAENELAELLAAAPGKEGV
ncbi:hypothetical protein QCC34_07475 [Pseudomonas aeruginosa]|uniref:hypothetical protein n=1 Tax=Pseudomonas aeruginosa TaxID=287 RepID=UPI0026DEBB8F|nr:hypothetical protein [Pseudomonas aeruginosa]MDO5935738.1 hypothetical protein [Pseudomonas aeruginosa]MDO5949469.1 hypothetical protein [Pseudomonas aeruginosa]HCP6202345.1 hypothetical protein [Pseudomonas aeruginosa]HCP6219903.1 hypothetical protein [Pseudomonas aeruginosa]